MTSDAPLLDDVVMRLEIDILSPLFHPIDVLAVLVEISEVHSPRAAAWVAVMAVSEAEGL